MHDQTTEHNQTDAVSGSSSIAIIGMSGRFPGAQNLDEFWANLVAGRDTISRFSVRELEEAGRDPVTLTSPKYIRAKGVLDDALAFDAGLFGFSPYEAEVIDPQQRIFLQTAMSALEDAGCHPDNFDGSIGIYAGQTMSSYIFAMLANPNAKADPFLINIGNDKDFLCSRVAYKLNLRGPCVAVAASCATSLVAVAMACQSLIDYQCDAAIAGGVCVAFPEKEGYMHDEGSNVSADGYCRAFDEQASGLVGGNGVGAVVLKRLDDALADRDHIHAVIRSCAINNDGATKIGYTAPSVDGQAEVISLTHALGDIDPATISYVEAHGTGTRLGDPIEVAGLTKAFRRKTSKTNFCAIGSVKTNIGHLDAAAGIAGLIKTVLAMKHRTIPPSLHFVTPNPQIDFANSPFFVCDKATPWETDLLPRRAGINSSAIGGNNAHVVLEEAPRQEPSRPSDRDFSLLTLSATGPEALKRVVAQMSTFIESNPSVNLADAAYSLQVGRKSFKQRLAVVCRDTKEAATLLASLSGSCVVRGSAEGSTRVAFTFPGQGAQHVGMCRGLYAGETVFRKTVDECADQLVPHLGVDVRTIIFATESDERAAAELDQTRLTQPALFTIEYALAKLWIHWGVRPAAMLGHSIGEFVAACIAGVMDLPDALHLVSRRGALMQSLPPGDMASIPLPEQELAPLLTPGLSLSAILGSALCVVAGNSGELDALKARLKGFGVGAHAIRTSHAFHSHEMEPILAEFAAAFDGVELKPPTIPFVSNLTGTWITNEDAVDRSYWARQLRGMVRLHDGLRELTAPPGTICLEVGPGRSLSSLAQQAAEGRKLWTIPSCRTGHDDSDDMAALLGAVGKLWVAGHPVDWNVFSGGRQRRKVPLPTYPFEQDEYSLLPDRNLAPAAMDEGRQRGPVSNLLYAPTWRQASAIPSLLSSDSLGALWVIFLDRQGVGACCAGRLRADGRKVLTIGLVDRSLNGGGRTGHADYCVSSDNIEDLKRICGSLVEDHGSPARILHFWSVGALDEAAAPHARVETCRKLCFDSLLYMVQGMASKTLDTRDPCLLSLVSTGHADIGGHDTVEAEKSLLVGPLRVIPTEYPHIKCKSIDLSAADISSLSYQDVDRLLNESIHTGPIEIALRDGRRWVRSFEAIYFNPHGDEPPGLPNRLRPNGTYLITGGLGGMGLEIAVHMAGKVSANLILTGRSLPESNAVPFGARPYADAVSKIEAEGGQVMARQADVTDHAAMAAVIEEAIERFGPIHGVVHAAGVAGRGVMQLKTAADVDRVLAPKIAGLLVLEDLFRAANLDFLVACSSIATVVGAPGQAEYTSANAFLDAFVHARRDSETRCLSINWDRWAEVGMAVKERTDQLDGVTGLVPDDGVHAFELALDSAERQIAVAMGPFEWISRYGPPRQQPVGANGHAAAPGSQRGHKRPDLETVFAPPGNEIEIGVAGLFHEVLGIKGVGIDDNFFDLGGHSLLGVQLVNRIQEMFHVRVGIGELFNLPSVRSLSLAIATRGVASAGGEGASLPQASQ